MSSESPPTLESEECEKLLYALLNNARTPKQQSKAVRNHCMALLMLDAGLRVGELVSLRMSDLYFQRQPVRTIFIKPHMTKNKVAHSIPVSDRLSKALLSYFKTWLIFDPEMNESYAFYSVSQDRPLTTRQVERIICAAALKALGRPVHPHMLRHTIASKWMRVTNEAVVQRLLGHKYLTSTQIYCHPNEDDKRQAIDQASRASMQDESLEGSEKEQPPAEEPQRPGPVPASPAACPHGKKYRWLV